MSNIDPRVQEVLKKYHDNPKAAVWNCHGTWVAYHKDLEIVAAKAGITFDPPLVLEANGANKTAALCVTGHMADRAEWSIGEASPANNKNGYPFAMAEKRAKDRVILKLLGLSGFVYSEEEADSFKPEQPKPAEGEPQDPEPDTVEWWELYFSRCETADALKAAFAVFWGKPGPLTEQQKAQVIAAKDKRKDALSNQKDAA
jgi:hypothetical protein